MGASISTTDTHNSVSSNSPILQISPSTMSSSSSSPDPKTLDSEPKTLETQTSTQPNNPPSMVAAEDPEKENLVDENEQSEAPREDQGEGEGEEEEGECGFCLFMKGGGCRDTFIAWEDCIKEAEDQKDDVVERCAQVTGTLRQCMEAHKDYYAPLLQAEKDMEEQAKKELQEEEEAKNVTERSEQQPKNELQEEEEAKNVTEQSEQPPKNVLQEEEEAKNVAEQSEPEGASGN